MKVLIRLLFKLLTRRVELIKIDKRELKNKNVRYILIFGNSNGHVYSLGQMSAMHSCMRKYFGFEGLIIQGNDVDFKVITSDKLKIKEAAILYDGLVYPGKRHWIILDALTKHKEGELPITIREEEQGFVDEAGRFFTREEAAKIALELGQIKRLKFQKEKLFSEDLY
jgi:hypothetical protein